MDAGPVGEGWLAPVVTNLAGRPVSASVVVDGDTIPCACLLAPGVTLHLGYYRAAGGTAVLVSDRAGWSGRLGALEATRDSVTGRVPVLVDSAALRPPSRPRRSRRARRRAAAPRAASPSAGALPIPLGDRTAP